MVTKSVTVVVAADPDQDDCLTAAAEAYAEEHPELHGWDLTPRWTNETRESVTLTVPRSADIWWAWHDRDSASWSASTDEAEIRCAAWVAGDSDDGPSA